MPGWARHGRNSGRYIVKTAPAERITAQKPPDRQRHSAQWAVRRDGGGGVLRTGRHVAATAAGVERMQRRGEPAAVKDEGGEQDALHSAGFAGAIGETDNRT